MADEFGEKTEAPTPRRRQEAREQGQVARSQDLTGAVLIVGAILLLNAFGNDLVKALRALLAETLSLRPGDTAATGAALAQALASLASVAVALAPVLVGVVLLVVVANLLQVGFVLNLKRLQPNLGALNPLKGLAKVFGKGRSPVQGLLAAAKLVVLVLVAYSAVRDRLGQIVTAQELSYLQVFALGADTIYSVGIRVGLALLVLAILDYA